MDEDFLPILARGEEYIEFEKTRSGPPINSKLPSYEEARSKLLGNIAVAKKTIKEMPDDLRVSDVVVNLKMTLGFTAKSFHPVNLIKQSGAEDIGSKKWTQTTTDKKGQPKLDIGKNVFLRMSEETLVYFDKMLNQKQSELHKGFIEDVKKIEDFYVSGNDSLIDIFTTDWKPGRIELVFHPFGELEQEVITKFFDLFHAAGGDKDKIRYKSYFPGPMFMSVYCGRDTLEQILRFNPIRTAHPLLFKGVPMFRGGLSGFALPNPPKGDFKSSIVVGMFDGGIKEEHPLLKRYVTERNPINTLESGEDLEHGIAVAGSMLYGNLKGYSTGSILPTPPVTVESYRVLPLSDPYDINLYEVIDLIEEVVPKRTDIKVFNLSIGPYGPIEEDYISRFTYVLDSLSGKGERLFTVAVGNDGEMPNEEDRRIQAPADIINGLGVGSYTYGEKGSLIRAPYSCIGEGREGCKVKPDIVAFGGCEDHPFHLLGKDGSHKLLASGTSFSSPIVASKAAELIGRCSVADPLVARALIVQSANHPNKEHDKYLGFGAIPESVEEILGCTENKVTVLYKNRILPTKFAKVNIPFIEGLDYKGPVDVTWTIAIATPPNPIHSEDYTTNCIEDFFYPNSNVFSISSPDKKHNLKRHLFKDKDEIEQLQLQGWKLSTHPVTASGNIYKNEQQRRADFKWDTIVKKSRPISKYQSIDAPYLVLHGMDRNISSASDFINYAIAITVHYKNYNGNAYLKTIDNYNKLEIVKIRSINEIMIRG
ncbi:S8 family peptidase [Paenibacillus terrae]|uniref:S8 family peptidase n=1 Tax=Paenibacillus terrae TaxID=159743 RepID=UPI0016568332|nr:S8 family peptidase [Paenibacillus terrae]